MGPTLPVESEIKLRVAGPDEARAALERLGAARVRERELEDNLLLDGPGPALLSAGKLLRLRRSGERVVLTYKGPRRVEQGIRSRVEVETALGDFEAARTIFEALGLRPVFRYQKYRETYAWKDVEIVVDETPIGTFLEIEGPLEGIHAAAAALGYGRDDYLTESYASLFFAAGGTGDMVFR